MKKVVILAMILLLAPISTFGSSNNIGVVDTQPETYNLVSETAQVLQNHFSNPYVDEWRNIRDTLQVPTIDFKIGDRRTSILKPSQTRISISPMVGEKQLDSSCAQICINGNDDFEEFDFPGSGTEEDPYIIEDMSLSGDNLVNIQNTNVHFELRFMDLQGKFGGYGILLNNVTNGYIHDNNLSNHYDSIIIEDSNKITIENNLITVGFGIGIYILRSTEILLLHNDISIMGSAGILIENSWSIDIVGNSVLETGTGLYVTSILDYSFDYTTESVREVNSTDISVLENSITDNTGNGILFESTTFSEIIGNTLLDNGQDRGDGLVLFDSQEISVNKNTISDHNGNGIVFEFTTNSEIIGNTLAYNGQEIGDGIVLVDSHDNTIQSNTIFGTGSVGEGSSIQLNNLPSGHLEFHAGFGGVGIFLDPSYNNTIEQNSVLDSTSYGVYVKESNDTNIIENDVSDNDLTGIFIEDSDSNNITRNVIRGNGYSSQIQALATNDLELIAYAGFGGVGIFLDPSVGNVINGNKVDENYGEGIALQYSSNSTISNNNVTRNGFSGISLLDSDYNKILQNNVTGSGQNLNSISLMSTGSPLEMKALAGFGGVGIFLDPSVGNVVEGNRIFGNMGMGTVLEESSDTLILNNDISANGGDGVALINSSNNKVSRNSIDNNGFSTTVTATTQEEAMNLYAGFGGVGIFLDPSPKNELSNNSISNNAASGVYLLESNNTMIKSNNVTDNGAHGVFLQNSSHNNLTGNFVEENGEILAQIGLSLNAGFGGIGIFLDPSWYNVILHNNVSSNTAEGLFLEDSHFTEIELNVFIANFGYGVSIDENSTDSSVLRNDFFENGGETSQAKDDGVNNVFLGNFWSDHEDPTQPYPIDGDANNSDKEPAATPNSEETSLIEVDMDFKPDAINALSRGRYVKVIITLPTEYEVVSVELDALFLNETIQPIAYSVGEDDDDNRRKNKHRDTDGEDDETKSTFTLYFHRSEVNDLVNSLGKRSKFFITLEITGTINGGELEIHGTDKVKVVRTIHDLWWFWWFLWWLFKRLGLFGGLILIKPLSHKINQSRKK